MTIIEMAPYINGDLYTRECVPPVRCTPEMFAKVVKAAAASDTYERTIEVIESYKNFWNYSQISRTSFRYPNVRRCFTA